MPPFIIFKFVLNYIYRKWANFKILQIQRQFYHLLGAMLPIPDAFQPIYCMANSDNRFAPNAIVKKTIVQELQIKKIRKVMPFSIARLYGSYRI